MYEGSVPGLFSFLITYYFKALGCWKLQEANKLSVRTIWDQSGISQRFIEHRGSTYVSNCSTEWHEQWAAVRICSSSVHHNRAKNPPFSVEIVEWAVTLFLTLDTFSPWNVNVLSLTCYHFEIWSACFYQSLQDLLFDSNLDVVPTSLRYISSVTSKTCVPDWADLFFIWLRSPAPTFSTPLPPSLPSSPQTANTGSNIPLACLQQLRPPSFPTLANEIALNFVVDAPQRPTLSAPKVVLWQPSGCWEVWCLSCRLKEI